MLGNTPPEDGTQPRDDLPPTANPAQNEEPATIDSAAFQIDDEDVSTIDSSATGMPMGGGDDSEAHTLDSAAHSTRRTSQELPESQASTILPIEENLEHFDGVDELPPKTPDRIASFTLMGVVGTGGMGRVYLAIQDRLRNDHGGIFTPRTEQIAPPSVSIRLVPTTHQGWSSALHWDALRHQPAPHLAGNTRQYPLPAPAHR